MSSKYSKFSDEILGKKINGLYNQCKKMEDILTHKTKDFEIKNYISREEMENLCDELTLYQNELKNKEKEFKKLEAEKLKQEEEERRKEAELLKQQQPKFEIINDLESLKRNFFNKEERCLDLLRTELDNNNYKYYVIEYNYSHTMFGKPEYMACNLMKGFVKRLDNYTKYLFGVFRCFNNKSNGDYIYISYILLNTPSSFTEILGNELDDFSFEEIDSNRFMDKIIENSGENNLNLLDENYIH